MYTTSSAILEALAEAGVEFIFANFGSDHPGLIEAIAQARAAGKPCPQSDHLPGGDGCDVRRARLRPN